MVQLIVQAVPMKIFPFVKHLMSIVILRLSLRVTTGNVALKKDISVTGRLIVKTKVMKLIAVRVCYLIRSVNSLDTRFF